MIAEYPIYKRKMISTFIIDETAVIQIGWYSTLLVIICIEPIHSCVLGIYISEERHMLVS